MSSWRPIESAPKDGSDILFYDRKGRYVWPAYGVKGGYRPLMQIGRWLNGRGWMITDEQCGGYADCEPSHWMPLPAPPEEGDE